MKNSLFVLYIINLSTLAFYTLIIEHYSDYNYKLLYINYLYSNQYPLNKLSRKFIVTISFKMDENIHL